MPELPEIETTLHGISPYLENQKIINITVRQPKLRWPVPANITKILKNQVIHKIERRGKYLLFKTAAGTFIIHLGMSGHLRILNHPHTPAKHDHIDIEFSNHILLRFADPRRFGAFLWTEENPLEHPLLKNLGPEPLSDSFTGEYLWERAKKRKVAIKNFIMDSKIVVGVGNIYATEALFAAHIHPCLPVNQISKKRFNILVASIQKVLLLAIKQGGTTLKDFFNSDGKPGYFTQFLKVYGRGGLKCTVCKTKLEEIRVGQRGTVYCAQCQI